MVKFFALIQFNVIILSTLTGFFVAFNLVLGLSFLSASFANFIVSERSEGAALLQRLTGVSPMIFWLSAFAFDLINFLVPCLTIIVSLLPI